MKARARLIRKIRKFFRRGEAGFVMIVVLVALLMLSVLGASTMLLMASSMRGVLNMNPEQRAFQVAEAGLYVGHTKIVASTVGSTTRADGAVLGGNYSILIEPAQIESADGTTTDSKTDFVVTSLGSCVKDGTTYRRKLQESVYYSGEQAFDAMRNYMFFAGRNLTAYAPADLNNYPIVLNGSIRAENDLKLINYSRASTWDYLVINGSVEAGNSIQIEAGGTDYYANQSYFDRIPNPLDSRGMNVMIYGDIKAGSVDNTATAGSVSLYAWSGLATQSGGKYVYVREGNTSGYSAGISSIFAATDGAHSINKIHTSTANNLFVSMPSPPGHDHIYQGTHVVDRSVQKVYIPQPNFEYYKAMAKDQDSGSDPHFFDVGPGNTATLPATILKSGISSMSVFYSTGNMKLSNSVWAQPQTNALFVCEGTFTAQGVYETKTDCKFQVIAGGDVNMLNDQSNRNSNPSTDVYFFYAKRDVNMTMTHFNQNNMQATALRDINLSTDATFSYATFNYQPPQVDVSGWPIDVIVKDWKELPVDQ
jgi:Tfp pilus assembly protein PilX